MSDGSVNIEGIKTWPNDRLSHPSLPNSHLAGIIMGYLTAWGALEKLSIPILAGISAIVVLQHSNAWAHKISSYSLLLKGWTGGIARRVARTRTMEIVFATHL